MHMCVRKEANLKKLHTVWFQLSDILEKSKTMETVNRSVIVRCLEKEERRWEWIGEFLGQWNYSAWYNNGG